MRRGGRDYATRTSVKSDELEAQEIAKYKRVMKDTSSSTRTVGEGTSEALKALRKAQTNLRSTFGPDFLLCRSTGAVGPEATLGGAASQERSGRSETELSRSRPPVRRSTPFRRSSRVRLGVEAPEEAASGSVSAASHTTSSSRVDVRDKVGMSSAFSASRARRRSVNSL